MSFPRDPFAKGTPAHSQAGTFYFAPEGDILVAGTPPFYERLGYRNPDFDLGDYAVRNMGFVAVNRATPIRLRVRFRPALLTGAAIDAVCRYVGKREASEIEINHFGSEWATEIWSNDGRLTQRLAELCVLPAASPSRQNPFDIKPLEIANAAKDYSNPLKPLFQKWRSSFTKFDDTTLGFMARFGYMSRLILVSRDSGQTPVFKYFGNAVRLYDEDTTLQLIGQPIDQQPDKKYGEWINAQYQGMLDARQPRLDSIEFPQKQENGETCRIGYDRLLLPWTSARGVPVITSVSVITSDERRTAVNENQPVSGGFGDGRGSQKALDLR